MGTNYHPIILTLFKRCLTSKEFPNCSKMIQHRIFHNLLAALINHCNYQNSSDSIQEFSSIAEALVNNSVCAESCSLYMTIVNGYYIMGRVDSLRLYSFLKQNAVLEKAYEHAVRDEKLIKKLGESDRNKQFINTLDKLRPPCCSKHSLTEILETWGVVQEQLAACYTLTNHSSFVQRGKWLLSAIKKYQDALLLEPLSCNLYFRVGCGYASWLKTKIEFGSEEVLTTDNIWLRNAELSWQRALQTNLYFADVYKQLVALYSYLGDHATDISQKQRFMKLAHEKHEQLEMLRYISKFVLLMRLSQQVINIDFFGQEVHQNQ